VFRRRNCAVYDIGYQSLRPLNVIKRPYHVTHGLEFDTTGHAAGGAWFLDARLVGFGEDPDSVVRMAENPKIVTTDVRQLLQIGLVDTREMQGIYKLVRRKGNLWRFCSSWRASEQEGTEERIRGLVRMRKCDCVAGRRLPNFPSWGDGPDGWKSRRWVEVEQDHEQVDDELPRRDIAGLLVRKEESDELREWSGAGAAKRKAPNLRSRQRL